MVIDAEAGRRIERQMAEVTRLFVQDHRRVWPDLGACAVEMGGAGGGIAVWGSRFGSPNTSRPFALGIDGPVTDDDLARVEAFYAERATHVRVVTCPWTHLSLFPLLAARGYFVSTFENVLVRALDVSEPPASPSDVEVRPVREGGAVAWGRLVREGFGTPPEQLDAEPGRITDAAFDGSPSARLFEASVDGVRAGGAAVVVHDRVAHLFATSTLPAHRRRGVHTALVRARLAHARDAGADLATVVTDAGGASQRSLEQASGFRVGYSRAIFSAPPLSSR